MVLIHRIIDDMMDEINGAKTYAEMYVQYKNTNSAWARKFKEMAEQELLHSRYIHEMAADFVNTLAWISEDDKDDLNHAYAKRAECEATIKLMLSA